MAIDKREFVKITAALDQTIMELKLIEIATRFVIHKKENGKRKYFNFKMFAFFNLSQLTSCSREHVPEKIGQN